MPDRDRKAYKPMTDDSKQLTGDSAQSRRNAVPPHHRASKSVGASEAMPDADAGRDASATTTRDTTEAEAYSKAHPLPEAEHATNQTTNDSLRRKRSHNRG